MDISEFIKKRKKITIEGNTYTLQQIDMCDIGHIRAIAAERKKAENLERKQEVIQLAKEIGEVDPMELLKFIQPISESDIDDFFNSAEGAGYLFLYSLKPSHPGLSLEEVQRLITVDIIEQYAEWIVTGKEPEPEKKTKSKQQKTVNGQQE